jgi:hypothetical protein
VLNLAQGNLLAADGKFPENLPLPDESHSFEPPTSAVRDVFVKAGKIYLIPSKDSYVLESPFNPEGKSTVEKFGKFVDSKKIDLPPKMRTGPWASVEFNETGYLMLNGGSLRFSKIGSNGAFDRETDIIYDGIRPAADSRGEPAQLEITRNRVAFLKEMNALPDTRLASIRRIPKAWKLGWNNAFLAISRLKNFPLLLISCPNDQIDGCKIDRVCRLENYRNRFSSALSGIALHPDRRIILVADQGFQKLHVINFESCFHSSYAATIGLPIRLKSLSGVFIDESKRLWISTLDRDDYNNSSVFYWDPEQWIK